MIDYKKLKLAHSLILQVNEKYSLATYVSCQYDTYHRLHALNSEWFEDFEDLDDLIAKLKELVASKPRYELKQEVWFVVSGEIKKRYISQIYKNSETDDYIIQAGGYSSIECNFYPSREALIQAQIDYWESLKFEDAIEYVRKNHDGTIKNLAPKECQHESDGKMYGAMEWGATGQLKCKKCGEFY